MKIFYLACVLLSTITFGQVGMGTVNPQGLLDLNNNDGTSEYGLVLPIVDNIQNIKTPQGDLPILGTIVYDPKGNVGRGCIRYYGYKDKETGLVVNNWSDCLSDEKKVIK